MPKHTEESSSSLEQSSPTNSSTPNDDLESLDEQSLQHITDRIEKYWTRVGDYLRSAMGQK